MRFNTETHNCVLMNEGTLDTQVPQREDAVKMTAEVRTVQAQGTTEMSGARREDGFSLITLRRDQPAHTLISESGLQSLRPHMLLKMVPSLGAQQSQESSPAPPLLQPQQRVERGRVGACATGVQACGCQGQELPLKRAVPCPPTLLRRRDGQVRLLQANEGLPGDHQEFDRVLQGGPPFSGAATLDFTMAALKSNQEHVAETAPKCHLSAVKVGSGMSLTGHGHGWTV